MERRDFIATVAATAAAGSSTLLASGHRAHKGTEKMNAKYDDVVDETAECIEKGEVCLAHCARLLAQGDKSMGDCNLKVQQMLACTQAMMRLASQQAGLAKKMAAVCAKACDECAEACKPHRSHHKECRECYEACVECAKACRKIA